MKTKDVFLAGGILAATTLLLILIVFAFNGQREGAGTARGVGIIGIAAQQENAKENETSYFDAGHGYVYQIRDGEIQMLSDRAPASYPFAFACGTFVHQGDFLNGPLRKDGDILFSEYPWGDVFPTWNRATGEYKKVTNLETVGASLDRSSPVSLEEITGEPIRMQKESCLQMTAGASIVTMLFFVLFGLLSLVAWIQSRKKQL